MKTEVARTACTTTDARGNENRHLWIISRYEGHNGLMYQSEAKYMNGTCVLAADYPVNDYAEKRLTECRNAA